jgi:hypothetical protein
MCPHSQSLAFTERSIGLGLWASSHYANGERARFFLAECVQFSLTIPTGGMVQRDCREFPSLQENYEHRIRTRTSEYLEFFPVP